jgi:hypothetical protein
MCRIEGANAIVYTYESPRGAAAVAYEGRDTRAAWHIRGFGSVERRNSYVNEYLSSQRLTAELRALLRSMRARRRAA